ncbi:MAG: hypothetical protein JST00_08285 [Deltaproteobacteria bacterium]|nr:hypothetical protein [Deltaproteobacteria bacterium]
MSVSSIGSAAAAGVRRATEAVDAVAVGTARGDVDGVDGAAALISARVQMAASVTVMRAANENLGRLVDLIA